MSFVSYSFCVLFLVVLLARFTIGLRSNARPFIHLLIVANVVFYGWFLPTYLVLLLFTTGVDFTASRVISRHRDNARLCKGILTASLAVNLGLLGYFKYAGFALEQVDRLAAALGLPSPVCAGLHVILPVGISFYTFQSVSYTIDVYRGALAPVRRFSDFFMYVTFFPQLVAGPIVRASTFLYQIGRPRSPRLGVFLEGSYLMIRGFFLKMFVADNLAPYVDKYWEGGVAGEFGGLCVLVLAFLFGCQIFADFAGYSDIARGIGYILGYRLPVNFDAPYIARSFKDFWTRWHITLSQWLRDYLYIPLGGNRLGTWRMYRNLLLVMLLGGFWHGAANKFIVWGAIHGSALALERRLGLQNSFNRMSLKIAWGVIVQGVVLLAWVFFRSDSCRDAMDFVGNFLADPSGTMGLATVAPALVFAAPIVSLHGRGLVAERVGRRTADRMLDAGRSRPAAVIERGVWAGIMLYLTLTAYGTSNAFVYFQF